MFSKDIQIEEVQMYLAGVPTGQIEKKFNIKGSATILNWVTNIEQFGIQGIKNINRTKTNYTYSFKLRVINWRLKHHASFPVTAKKFGILSPAIIWCWERANEEGRLKNRKQGRPIMSKLEDDKIKQLEKENLYLKVENAYLKKLEALDREKEALQIKKML